MNINNFIDELITELAYRLDSGIPDLKNKQHLSVLSEILTEWGMSELENSLIPILTEEQPPVKSPDDDKYSHKSYGYYVRKGDEDNDEAQLYRKDGDQYISVSKDEYEEKAKEQGELGTKATGVDTKSKTAIATDTDGEPQVGYSLNPNTKTGKDYVENLPDGDPAKKKTQEIDELLEIYYNIGNSLTEASIFQSKYSVGTQFIAIKNTKELFKEGLPTGETIPKGPFTKVTKTTDYVEVNLGGNEVVWVQASSPKKIYKILGTKSKLQSMFGHMRKGAKPSDINWNTETMETAAAMGVFVNGYSILRKLNDDVKTDDDLPNVINSIKKQISVSFGMSDDYANINEIKSKIDNLSLANWYQLASLMAGMTKFTDSVLPNWSSKYIIHNSITKYYNVINKSDLIDGSKQNTADLIISNTPTSTLLSMIESNNKVEFNKNGICFIPNTNIQWVQVSLKKVKGGAQLGKIYSFLKDKFNLLDTTDVLNIALEEGISDFIKKGKDFIKNVGSSFMDKLKSIGSFMNKIGNKINKHFSKPPKKEFNSLKKELQRAGLKSRLSEGVLYESNTMFDTLTEIGSNPKILGVLVDNVNKKLTSIKNLANNNNTIWVSNVKKISPKSPTDPDTVGKILSNYQGLSVIETLIGDIDSDANTLYKNLVELEKEMIYGKTKLPLYKVYGMKIDDTSVSYQQYPGSDEFIQTKMNKEIIDTVVFFLRITEQSNYYTLTVYGLNDVDEATGKFQYVQYRIGTNATGKYTFNFEGVKFIELGKVKQLLGVK